MKQETSRESTKRRMMFVPGEDFYFLTYILLVLLNELNAKTEERSLSDSRKLAYLADFISGDSDLLLATSKSKLSSSGRARLSILYDRASARKIAAERLIEAICKHGLIKINRESGSVDKLYLVQSKKTEVLLSNLMYRKEVDRIKKLRKVLPMLRTMSLDTIKQRLFGDRGVLTWGD